MLSLMLLTLLLLTLLLLLLLCAFSAGQHVCGAHSLSGVHRKLVFVKVHLLWQSVNKVLPQPGWGGEMGVG